MKNKGDLMKKNLILLFGFMALFIMTPGNSAEIKPGVSFFNTEGMDEEYRNFLNNYSIDKNIVYYNGKKLSGIDSESFVYIADFYTKDKNNVYYYNIKLENSNPETFKYLGYRYAKDKNSVYYRGKKIKNADVKTFEIQEFYRAKDKNRYYMHGEAENIEIKKGF
jgi:hypothetical protein